jgi:hypothetical protein
MQKHEKWLRENLGSRCLAPLTSTDAKALAAAVAIVELWTYDDHDSVIEAFHNIVLRMQPKNWHLAYHAIAMVRNWEDRALLWQMAGLGDGSNFGRCQFEPGGVALGAASIR